MLLNFTKELHSKSYYDQRYVYLDLYNNYYLVTKKLLLVQTFGCLRHNHVEIQIHFLNDIGEIVANNSDTPVVVLNKHVLKGLKPFLVLLFPLKGTITK